MGDQQILQHVDICLPSSGMDQTSSAQTQIIKVGPPLLPFLVDLLSFGPCTCNHSNFLPFCTISRSSMFSSLLVVTLAGSAIAFPRLNFTRVPIQGLDDPCAPQPIGSAPRPAQDTVDGFYTNPAIVVSVSLHSPFLTKSFPC